MSTEKIVKGLLISFYFPPLNSMATHRIYSFVKYLNNSKLKLDVICPEWEGDLAKNIDSVRIIHTPKRVFDQNFGEREKNGVVWLKDLILNRVLKIKYFRGRLPGSFYREVIEQIEKLDLNEYDFVITSYGPLDSIHIGRYIKKKYKALKWIIDYRDLYSELEYYNMGITRSYFRNYEKKITELADGFITVSEVLKNKLEKLLEKKGKLIYNGYEDFMIGGNDSLPEEIEQVKLPIIAYVGSLYQGERDPLPFLEYFKATGLSEKYCCVFAVINDLDEVYLRKILAELQVMNVIVIRNLKHNESIALQKKAAFLLLLSNFNGRGNGYLTGKVFEYIAAEKPIIYSGTTEKDFELYQLIVKYKLGDFFGFFDFENSGKYAKGDYTFFHRKNQASELEEFITGVLGK